MLADSEKIQEVLADTHLILDKSVGRKVCKAIFTRHFKSWKLEAAKKDEWANECSDRLRTLFYVAKKEMQRKPMPCWIAKYNKAAVETSRNASLASSAAARIRDAADSLAE